MKKIEQTQMRRLYFFAFKMHVNKIYRNLKHSVKYQEIKNTLVKKMKNIFEV